MDRDLNAAINIQGLGSVKVGFGQGMPEFMSVETALAGYSHDGVSAMCP